VSLPRSSQVALSRRSLTRALSRLKQLALLCGASLLVSPLSMTYGLDLSPGFF
jgi:hypothetical protein